MPELPPPLPPETRTVGQLVAETIRLYGAHFWRVLPLGLPLAAIDQFASGRPLRTQIELIWAGAPFLTAAYVAASALAGRVRPTARSATVALVTGLIVFLPAAALKGRFELLSVAWLALFGLVVPVAVIERTGFRETFLRARSLATADYVHALGSLATLTIVFFLSQLLLSQLLQSQGDNAQRVAVFAGDVVVSPLLLLGAALLYFDQAARRAARPR